MTRYVIDAATLLHLVDHDVRVDAGHQLVAPNAIRSEAMQLMLDQARRGERTDREAREAHVRMTELKIRLLGDRVSRATAWKMAREQECTIREGEYLAVARLQADALVTVDPDLAAKAQGVVPLASVDALTTSA